MVPSTDLHDEARRRGRFRRHARSGTWSARFVLPPGPDGEAALDHVEDLAVCMGRLGGLSEDDAVFVGVALREAVENAFRHGRSPDDAPARIALHLTPQELVITVRDRGPGFDPASVPDPCVADNLARGCGRGIYYMRRFTDRVSFVFPRQGGSVVRLAKRTRPFPS
ncbi:MAG TPA: ATP-binding protein [Vicinamibacteria bacterium]|nr:ATP-binding protein [Vicinamibacteria bacterium]